MFARSTTVHARTEMIDQGVDLVRDEVMPALHGMEGCVGLSMIVDRHAGRCITTSAWQNEQAMRDSEDRVRSLRDRVAEAMGGRMEVEEWEIALLHRDHRTPHGACVRATWFQLPTDRIDRAHDVYRMISLPALEELEGFCSASLMINRSSGRCVSSVTFDSQRAMEASRERAASIRQSSLSEAGAEMLDVCEFELALAHLRVPELA